MQYCLQVRLKGKGAVPNVVKTAEGQPFESPLSTYLAARAASSAPS